MRHLARLLIVEDERVIALNLRRRVTRLGYTVVARAATGPEAISQALEHRPDLVLMDIHLQGDIDGVEAAQCIQAQVLIPVIYLSAYVDEIPAARVRATHSAGFLPKPVSDRDLQGALTGCWARRRERPRPSPHRPRQDSEGRLTTRRTSSVHTSLIVAPTRPPRDPIRLGCVALHAALKEGVFRQAGSTARAWVHPENLGCLDPFLPLVTRVLDVGVRAMLQMQSSTSVEEMCGYTTSISGESWRSTPAHRPRRRTPTCPCTSDPSQRRSGPSGPAYVSSWSLLLVRRTHRTSLVGQAFHVPRQRPHLRRCPWRSRRAASGVRGGSSASSSWWPCRGGPPHPSGTAAGG
jgi:CheY-like chemotaxis protein